MKFTKILPPYTGGTGAIGLLILRIAAGSAMMIHGTSKIQAPFSWMGANSSVPPIFQAAAALSEFGGGLALILGLLTPLAALGIIATMTTAYLMMHRGDAFVATKPGQSSIEILVLHLTIAIMLLLNGPGKLSLDALLFKKFARKS